MDSLTLSVNAIAPVFLLMLLGFFFKQIKLVSKEVFDGMNTLVFKAFLPTLLFYNVYSTDNIDSINLEIFLFTVFGVIGIFILGFFAVRLITRDNSRRATMLQGFFRSNFAILGIPLINSICGDKISSLTYLMVALVIPLFNVLAVLCFEIFGKKGHVSFMSVMKGIATNPLIIGCMLGLLFYLFGIELPSVLEKAVSDISSIATPLSIVILGASFTFSSIKGHLKEILTVVLSRLIFIPVIMLSIAVLIGFRGEALACLLIVAGGPIAVSSFSMAKSMGGDEELAASLVVISSAFCILTLFGWIFILSSLGLF